MNNVRLLLAKNGRYAVMARESEHSTVWVQVESVLGHDNAQKLAEQIEDDDSLRHLYIADSEDESDWGNDAPKAPPL